MVYLHDPPIKKGNANINSLPPCNREREHLSLWHPQWNMYFMIALHDPMRRKRNGSSVGRYKITNLGIFNLLSLRLKSNFVRREGSIIEVATLYSMYIEEVCLPQMLEPMQKCLLGKLVHKAFKCIYTRRVGPTGHQRSHYIDLERYEGQAEIPHHASSPPARKSSTPKDVSKYPKQIHGRVDQTIRSNKKCPNQNQASAMPVGWVELTMEVSATSSCASPSILVDRLESSNCVSGNLPSKSTVSSQISRAGELTVPPLSEFFCMILHSKQEEERFGLLPSCNAYTGNKIE